MPEISNEIGFDGRPRFVCETRTCTYFDRDRYEQGLPAGCGAQFDVVVDRHGLGYETRTCASCRRRHTTSVAVWGKTRSGRSTCVFSHTIITKESRERMMEIARNWAREFVADGGTVTWHITRHTAQHGSRTRRVRGTR